MGKLHKRTHLGARRVSKRARPAEESAKLVTARPPAQGETFVAAVPRHGATRLETAPGCYRTYRPPEEEE